MPRRDGANDAARSAPLALLLTDIEGSTRLWEENADLMSEALAAHDALVRRAVERAQGTIVKMTGDGVYAVFDDAPRALDAALEIQHSLTDAQATAGVALRARCGLHAGVVERRDDDYFGAAVNRGARIMSAAHGGQVLLSQAVAERVREALPASLSLRDLGKVRLKDLATPEHVWQVVDPRLRQDFPPLRSLEATPNNLPQQVTAFVGRDEDLRELTQLLATTRLLTLTGSGGCGKTRLALQVAADRLDEFPDGAWFVELAPLTTPTLVAPTLAAALGVEETSGETIERTLIAYLADKRSLIVLDNCEHLIDVCARLAETIVQRCAAVTILATSREALGIGGERAYRVRSLSLPDAALTHTPATIATFEAVQLFVDRARLVRSDFALTDRNAAVVASICSRLDGIPLAIELAAARTRAMTVDEIDAKLNQRFRLLTGGSRTALPRHQTLRSLIDWSYDLLSEPAKAMLQRLSAFAGGCALAAAVRVCAADGIEQYDVVDLLTSLCDKSLAAAGSREETSRYRLVETVRQYAREKLAQSGSAEVVRERHLDYFVSFAETTEINLAGGDQADWLRRLEDEHDNLRSALEWSLEGPDIEAGLRLCAALQRFWLMHGHISEGRDWCARVVDAAGAGIATIAGAKALSGAGVLAYHQGAFAASRALHERSLAIRRELGDRRGEAISLNNLGMIALDQGDLASARTLHEQSLAIARVLGNRNGIARSLGNLGMVAAEQSEFASAKTLYDECLALLRDIGDRDGEAIALHQLADLARMQGDLDGACTLFGKSLSILRDIGHKGRIAYSLDELAALNSALGRPLRAASLFGAARRLREELGAAATDDARVCAARSASHDEAAFEQAWEQGRALTLEQAIGLALEFAASRA